MKKRNKTVLAAGMLIGTMLLSGVGVLAAVTLPEDGSRYVPQAGDVIDCGDGTQYTITDVVRWDSSVYAQSPLPELPAPTCDWSAFPELVLPEAEVRHFSDGYGDDLFVRSLYETRRMQYTVYNALGGEESAWRDGFPLSTVQLTIPTEKAPYAASFWPWDPAQLEDLVHSRPNSQFYLEAWDYYHNGVYQYTEYCSVSW